MTPSASPNDGYLASADSALPSVSCAAALPPAFHHSVILRGKAHMDAQEAIDE
jgi:hypothetical protein